RDRNVTGVQRVLFRSCHVAGGAFGVGAAAEAGDGAVDHADTFFEYGVEVGDGLAVGVVEVGGELVHGDVAAHRFEHALGGERGRSEERRGANGRRGGG